jgi:D-galactarolactone isomerase
LNEIQGVPVTAPNTDRNAARAMPANACDCHMHVYEPGFATAATWPFPVPAGTLSAYREVRRELGLARCVVVQPNAYGFDNSCTEGAIRALGDSARGVATIAPTITDAELERLNGAGFRSARCFMLPRTLFTWDDVDALAQRIAPLGWHIDLQLDGRELPQYAERLRRLPCRLVIDHNGKYMEPVAPDHPAFATLLELLDGGRVWVKLSAPYETSRSGPPRYEDVSILARRLAAHAPERCLWASNWPHPGQTVPPSNTTLLDLFHDWTADDTTRQRILVSNPAQLYGF